MFNERVNTGIYVYLSGLYRVNGVNDTTGINVEERGKAILEASLFLAAEYVHEDIYKSCYINT
jgi:hypothetical protein